MLRDLYVKLYQLHSERGMTNTALDVITMTNKEGHWQLGPLSKRLQDYRICKIKDKFGLSWTEFIEQPRYMVLEQIEIALREIAEDASRANDESNVIDTLLKQYNLGPEVRGDLLNVLRKK